jgi:hypothetical protein
MSQSVCQPVTYCGTNERTAAEWVLYTVQTGRPATFFYRYCTCIVYIYSYAEVTVATMFMLIERMIQLPPEDHICPLSTARGSPLLAAQGSLLQA